MKTNKQKNQASHLVKGKKYTKQNNEEPLPNVKPSPSVLCMAANKALPITELFHFLQNVSSLLCFKMLDLGLQTPFLLHQITSC